MVSGDISRIRHQVLTLSGDDTRWRETEQTLEHPALQALLDYYEALRPAPDALPPIGAFRAMDLPEHLPYVALIALNHEGRTGLAGHYYRVFGSALTRLMDMELTGLSMADVHSAFPERTQRSYAMHCHVAERARPMRITGPQKGTAKDFIRVEALLLPFAEDGKTADHLITELRF
ncbi:PAS domain-containing protein [Yunchengibacter salinarum]|uniref:PAS domain-containing protein n=1 Tax=Yunchengibacter salinarum TaxID=3133399 RepID=UPI0035B69BE4